MNLIFAIVNLAEGFISLECSYALFKSYIALILN